MNEQLNNLHNLIAQLFADAQSENEIKKAAQLQVAVDAAIKETSTETDALIAKNAELQKFAKDLVLHQAYKPEVPGAKQNEPVSEPKDFVADVLDDLLK